jgi:hypothetical protein
LQIGINSQVDNQTFALIIREDNGFLFQRFYANAYLTPNILTLYSGSVELPYEPIGYNNRYDSEFYDFEFCEFDNCAFPAKESYQMPAKSGDEFQFNVIPYTANVEPFESVDIGIFDKNFNLIQKVGETTQQAYQCCQQYVAQYGGIASVWTDIIDTANSYVDIPATHSLGLIWLDSNNIPAARQFWFPLMYPLNLGNIGTFFEGLSDSSNIFEWISAVGFDALKYTPLGYECTNSAGLTCYIQLKSNTTGIIEGWEMGITGGFVDVDTLQQQAKALIPALKSDCYRLGLYKFESGFDQMQTNYLTEAFEIPSGENFYFAFSENTLTTNYSFLVALPQQVQILQDVINWLAVYMPAITVVQDNSYTNFRYCPYNNILISEGLAINYGTWDYSNFTPIINDEASTGAGMCGSDTINEIYSFSNLLYLDDSDCFSTILQYWAESNAIAEGFEYYNDWYQQVRLGINGGGKKPVITDSLYRQSNGVTRRPQNKQDLSIDLHTDFLDFETQSALVDATRHTNFVVDGQNLFVNGDIEVATIQDFTTQSSFEDLAQVKFSALIQGYQPKNSTCVNC